MSGTPFEQTPVGSGSLTSAAVLLATLVLVVLTAAVPFSGLVGGPLLLFLGVRGRRDARAARASTLPFDVAVLAGTLVIGVAVAAAGVLGLLMAVPGTTSAASPTPVVVP
jgi:hypothetical protein